MPEPVVPENEKVLYQKANSQIYHILLSQKQNLLSQKQGMQDNSIENDLTESEKTDNFKAELSALLNSQKIEQNVIDQQFNELLVGDGVKSAEALTFQNVRPNTENFVSLSLHCMAQNKRIKALETALEGVGQKRNLDSEKTVVPDVTPESKKRRLR